MCAIVMNLLTHHVHIYLKYEVDTLINNEVRVQKYPILRKILCSKGDNSENITFRVMNLIII